jgi:hypothetical protein
MVRLICFEEGAVFDIVDMSDAELEDAYGAKVVRKYEVGGEDYDFVPVDRRPIE